MAPPTDRSSEAERAEAPPADALSELLAELARAPDGDAGRAWEAALRPGAVVGRYELVREVARGGFGTVWEARDRELRRPVAFKALRVREVASEDRLLAEAEAAARLSHPNIVTLHDVGRTAEGAYLVYELLRGRTLAARLADGTLPPPEALAVAIAVASALAHAHAHGVVHRDVTPANVFLCDDGQVKVLDLGMAHAFGHRKLDGGTPAYMAPEQRRGAPEDERTDVFALGVLLHQMLAGALPFPEGASGGRPPELDVPGAPGLGPLVARMLAPDPVSRPRDAGAVVPELRELRAGLERASAGGRVVRTRRPARRLAIAVAGAVLVAAVAAGVALRGARPARALSSVAVLPFADLSPERDQGYFSDGVAEEIRNALTRVEALKVSGRASSFAVKAAGEDLRGVGRMLGVDAVLEGSVRKAGDRVRVTAELVSVADGYRLWSETFDRHLGDVLAVEDEIAAAVAKALRVKLSLGRVEAARAMDPRVHDEVLLGSHFLARFGPGDPQRAKAALERAVELDPRHAPAWAKLALATFWVADTAGPAEAMRQGYAAAFAAAEKAVALDPDLAEAHAVRGFLRASLRWDLEGALADVERALALEPGDGETVVEQARTLAALGRWDDAIAAARRATEIDPLSAGAWSILGWVLSDAGQTDRALAALDRAIEVGPEHGHAKAHRSALLIVEGRPADAVRDAEGTPDPLRHMLRAAAYHDLGDARASQREIDALVARYADSAAVQIAAAYAWRGDRDRAFEWLDRAYAQHDTGLSQLKMMLLFGRVHDDPRWGALLRRIGLPEG